MRVTLPEGFIGLNRYPGYFYNTLDNKLYSIKTGELKPLKLNPPFRNHLISISHHYKVSIKGFKKCVTVEYLETLKNSQMSFTVEKSA